MRGVPGDAAPAPWTLADVPVERVCYAQGRVVGRFVLTAAHAPLAENTFDISSP